MKAIRKIYFAQLILAFVIYVGVRYALSFVFTKPVDYWEVLIGGIIVTTIIVAINMSSTRSLLKSKIAFLKNEDPKVPDFADKIVELMQVEQNDFSFEVIKFKIKEKYEIDMYEDIEQNLIKFHSSITLFSWGVGGCISYEAPTKKIKITCFPMNANTSKSLKNTEAVLQKISSMIKTK